MSKNENGVQKRGNAKKGETREKEKSSQWLLEVFVSAFTAKSTSWRSQLVPFSVQLFLADRPSYLIVRDSWNPVPFEHFPSKPATCSINTPQGSTYVWTDAHVWSRHEIRAACEDCDFVAGNMWFYIPSGTPRSPDDLFENVINPILEWSRKPSGSGELIGGAEDSLGLLYWNIPQEIIDLAISEVRKMSARMGVRIENSDEMVVDLDAEEFIAEEDVTEDDVPRQIPRGDWFWIGVGLAVLQLIYLITKLDYFRKWWD